MLVALVLGGLAAGLVAIAARLLGGNSQDVLFSGQAAVPDVVAEGSGSVLVVLLVAKALGYAICLGCGFRGGPVFPAIFLGVAIATFAVIFLDTSPTWAVAVGAAAGLTAGTGLVFSGLVFSMLLVGTGRPRRAPRGRVRRHLRVAGAGHAREAARDRAGACACG